MAGAEVVVECPDLCPRFTARVFEDVTIGPSPPWLKARLMAAGHAPDLQRRRHHQLRDAPHRAAAARLRPRPGGRAAPRRAPRGATASRSTPSTAQTRTLDADMVLIADDDGPTSIAGVMGGARSEVEDDDDARAHGGRRPGTARTSTAPRRGWRCAPRPRGRNEKGLQPEQALEAQAVATELDARAHRRAPRAGDRSTCARPRCPPRGSSCACATRGWPAARDRVERPTSARP